MISIEKAIKIAEELNLPKDERKKVIKIRESWRKFEKIAEQVEAMKSSK